MRRCVGDARGCTAEHWMLESRLHPASFKGAPRHRPETRELPRSPPCSSPWSAPCPATCSALDREARRSAHAAKIRPTQASHTLDERVLAQRHDVVEVRHALTRQAMSGSERELRRDASHPAGHRCHEHRGQPGKDRAPREHDHRTALVARHLGEPDVASFGLRNAPRDILPALTDGASSLPRAVSHGARARAVGTGCAGFARAAPSPVG